MRSLTRYDDAFAKSVCVYASVCVCVLNSNWEQTLRIRNVSQWKRDGIASVKISLLLSTPDLRSPSGHITINLYMQGNL